MKNTHAIDLIRIGEKIRRERVARGLSQEALAGIVSKSRNFLSGIENGNKAASIETYYRLACALGISLGDLFRVDIQSSAMDEAVYLFSDCSELEAQALLDILRTVIKHLRSIKAANE